MDRPHIVLILMDTQRADNISCYGYSKKTTPNIDKIADEGAIFFNNITPGVWTLPSHASLFTGRYVSGHGADANCEVLPVEFPTMAEILGKLGYQTVGFSNNGWVSRKTGIARGFQEFYLISREVGKEEIVEWFYVEEGFKEVGERDKGSLKTVNVTISWLKKRWNHNKPFFIFINFIEPHGPYWPPEPFRSRFMPSDISEEEVRSVTKLSSVDECIDIRVGALRLSEREWRIEKALYDGCTATLDDRIGKLFSYLNDEGLIDETLFIITSDHGDVQGEHTPHVEHHLCAYDELVRVPLIIRYPKAVPKAIRVKWITQTHDLLPTILDILGIKDKEYWRTLQGVSLLPSMVKGRHVREYALTEYNKSVQQFFLIWRKYPDFDIRCFNYWFKALRSLKYKYIWYSNGIDELYDLEKDPRETHNIAEEQPAIVRKMRSDLEKMLLTIDIVDYGDIPTLPRRIPRFGADIVKREYNRLKAWGFYRDIRPAKLPEEEDIVI